MPWPAGKPNVALLCEETLWPVATGFVDRLVVLHGLECSEQPEALVEECWRVLGPGGRAVFMVPNRAGLWSRSEATPFGHGRPYSPSQLEALLRRHRFATEGRLVDALPAALGAPVLAAGRGHDRDGGAAPAAPRRGRRADRRGRQAGARAGGGGLARGGAPADPRAGRACRSRRARRSRGRAPAPTGRGPGAGRPPETWPAQAGCEGGDPRHTRPKSAPPPRFPGLDGGVAAGGSRRPRPARGSDERVDVSEPASISAGHRRPLRSAVFDLGARTARWPRIEPDIDALEAALAGAPTCGSLIDSPIYIARRAGPRIGAVAARMGLRPW